MDSAQNKSFKAKWSVDELNRIFTPFSFRERLEKLYCIFREEDIMVTSSFGASSVFLLYWLSKIAPKQAIYFLDTTYHFEETLAYLQRLKQLYNLNVVVIKPSLEENQASRDNRWWSSEPTHCCHVNKVKPLAKITAQHQIWVSGLMGHQTPYRENLDIFQQQGEILKFYPMIDLIREDFDSLMKPLRLPKHPLEAMGFDSVGCRHCTAPGVGRSGRWKEQNKTECGLHTNYFKKEFYKN